MHARVVKCMYVCMYGCMHACMHVYMYASHVKTLSAVSLS